MTLINLLFLLTLNTPGPITDDRIESHTVVIKQVDDHWEMRVDRRVAMKTHAGMRLARFAIPVSPRREMKDFSGSLTIGKRVDPAGKPKLYKQGSGEISDFKYWSVLVPGLKPKSRLEYGYTYVMDDPTWLSNITFGDAFPIDQMSVELHLPKSLALDHGFINPDKVPVTLETLTQDQITIYRFTAANLPARAPFGRDAQLFAGIHQADKKPWQAFADKIAAMYSDIPTGDLSKAAEQLAAFQSRQAYIQAAYQLARDQVRYESIPLGDHDYKAASPAAVLHQRYGDCKDKAWLLHQLLALRNINAHLVLVSSGSRLVPETDVAAATRFDHMILAVPGDDGALLFLDATSDETLGRLPQMDRGAEALIITKDGYQRLSLPNDGPTDQWDIQASMDDTGLIQWRIHLKESEIPFSELIRVRSKQSRARQERALAAHLLSERLHHRLHHMTLATQDHGITLEISEQAQRIGDRWVLPESPLPGPTPPQGNAPYNHFQRIRRQQIVTWTLPSGLNRPQTDPVNLTGEGYRIQITSQGARATQDLELPARMLSLNPTQRDQLTQAVGERFWSPVKGAQ